MLEKRKAQVLLAYRELSRYGFGKYAGGTVSAIDRERGLIVVKSAQDALVVDMQGNVLEGTRTPVSDIRSHIAIYQAFPQLGGVVQSQAGFAFLFARAGKEIPLLRTLPKGCIGGEIPCAPSASEMGRVFRERSIDPLETPAALVLRCGAYAWGETALDAVNNAAALEETADMAYHTLRLDTSLQTVPQGATVYAQ